MKSKLLITALLAFVVLITACAPAPGETPTPRDTAIIPETGDTATEAETATPTTEAATETQAPTETQAVAETATVATDTDVTVMVNEQGVPAPFLAEGQGRSLYAYMNDSQNSSTSSCIDDCAIEWPPLLVTGMPAAGTGVDAALLGTLRRDDGSIQATYNGWPLYYYGMDTIPGTTNGQSYNGVWFLISPAGKPIQK